MLYLGIDGGASKTTFLLCDEKLNQINRIELSSSNANDVGFEVAKEILSKGIYETCKGYPLNGIILFAGLSGGKAGGNYQIFHDFFKKFGFYRYANGNDIDSVKELGLKNDHGIVMIMGTGIIAYAVKNGEERQIGGWGQFFDEGGGGYNYGKDGIIMALKSIDGRGKPTLLKEIIEERIGGGVAENINVFYKYGRKYIASFCKDVFEAYKRGDEAANEIIEKNVKEVAEILKTGKKYLGETPVRVRVAGSLTKDSKIIFSKLEKYLELNEYDLECIEEEPVIGAVKIAVRENKNFKH